jgi:gamma-glutamyltranspeptidase/glutathione hydrolase
MFMHAFKRLSLGLLTLCLLLPGAPLHAGTAAVAMPDDYSAAASREVLEAGGNAVDAAITAVFTLAVTYPEAGNIGGGGFMVVHMAGKPAFLDFREKAPLGADRDMYLDNRGEVVQRRSLVGGLAVGVPGTVRGMQKAHQRYGRLPWRRLLAPAIKLAEEGFEVHESLGVLKNEKVDHFSVDTNFARYFGDMDAGRTFRQPELAETLQRIAHDPGDFYRGHIARQIVEQMQRSGGLMTARDLTEYTAVWRTPLVAPWRGHEIVTAAPPSSGGIALIQLLAMHDAAATLFNGVEHNSARYVHLLAELEKRAFADRAEYLGDPDFVKVPVRELLDPDYIRRRAAAVNPEGISPDVKPGLSPAAGTGAARPESPQTTHFSVLDGDGNAASVTYTQNWEFGSGVVVEGAGFLLNNQMNDFSAKPGVPNAFGVVGDDSNAIEPGKRMLSSMTPSILLRDGRVAAVIGTPGGSTIFTSVMQVLLNWLDFGMTAQDAVSATRFHHQLPAAYVIRYDRGREIDPLVEKRLVSLGYTVQPNWWGTLGDVQLVIVDAAGKVDAAADPRGRGRAAVFEVPDPPAPREG